MFDDYLRNLDTYNDLENYFALWFSNLITSLDKPSRFKTPHYNTSCVDGTRIMDANPIFSTRNEDTNNILRVVIHDGAPSLSEIHNDIDDYQELCIVTNIKSVEAAREKIYEWVRLQIRLSN